MSVDDPKPKYDGGVFVILFAALIICLEKI